jgi:hypothetical protein
VLPAGEAVIVATGKFGPYIRCGALSRAVPKVGHQHALLARLLSCLLDHCCWLLLCWNKLQAPLPSPAVPHCCCCLPCLCLPLAGV